MFEVIARDPMFKLYTGDQTSVPPIPVGSPAGIIKEAEAAVAAVGRDDTVTESETSSAA